MFPPKLSSHTHSIQFKRDSNAHRWWLGGGWRQQRRSSGVTRGRHARGEATPGHGRRRRHARRRTEVGVPCAPGSAHQSQLSGERRCEHGLQAKAIVAASMRLHGIMRLGVVHTRDAWCIVHRRASIRLHDAWCMVHGASYTGVHRYVYTMHGAWCMVHGAWCMGLSNACARAHLAATRGRWGWRARAPRRWRRAATRACCAAAVVAPVVDPLVHPAAALVVAPHLRSRFQVRERAAAAGAASSKHGASPRHASSQRVSARPLPPSQALAAVGMHTR